MKKSKCSSWWALLQGTIDDAQAFEDAAHILVVDRDDDGGAGQFRLFCLRPVNGVVDATGIAAAVDYEESDDGGAESRRDMREQDDEQEKQRDLQAIDASAPEEVGHEPGGKTREDEDARRKTPSFAAR
jgi:hypothetical protein